MAVLRKFEASFIKWRYETMAMVIRDLNFLRALCEGHMREELFNDVQDKETFKKVLAACRNTNLWRWLNVPGRKVIRRCEKMRRWSMVCNCPAHIEQRRVTKRHVKCSRASRRLDEVYDMVTEEVKSAREDARNLTKEDCEGDQPMTNRTRDMLLKYASLLELRCKYLALIPWRFAAARKPPDAAACLKMLNETPQAQLDTVSRKFVALMPDLQAVADGGAISAALDAEITKLCDGPLDESAGEGYHRGTNLVHSRAPVATTETVVQEVRLDSVLTRLKAMSSKYGRAGRNVIRYEWRHWKRVLQCKRTRLFRNKKLPARAAYRRIYREDALAKDNWDQVVSRRNATPPIPIEDNIDAVQREYAIASLVPKRFYMLDRRRVAQPSSGSGQPPPQDVGDAVPEPGGSIFQITAHHHGQHRPKIMKTIKSHEDVVLHGKIALQVQWYDMRELYQDEPGRASVFMSGDPIWMDHHELATFNELCYKLFAFRSVEQDPADEHCLVLSDRQAARPMIPLLDEKCPSLCLLWALQVQGWHYQKRKCTHTLENIKTLVLDGREIIRKKLYLMVLLKLKDHLRRTSSVPSDQTQLYYRLLLAGKTVEPNLPLQDYIDMAGGRGKILPLPMPEPGVDVPLPLPEPPVLDEDLVVAVEAPVPKPKRARAKPSALPLPEAKPEPPALPPPSPPAPLPPPVVVEPGPGGESGPSSGGGCPGGGEPVAEPGPGVDPPGDDDLVVAVVPRPEDPQPRADRRQGRWKDALGGGKISFDDCTTPAGVRRPNWKITCIVCPAYKGCKKGKGIHDENLAKYGRIGPLVYLHAWRHVSLVGTVKKHSRLEPTAAEMEAVMAAHGPELEALADECLEEWPDFVP